MNDPNVFINLQFDANLIWINRPINISMQETFKWPRQENGMEASKVVRYEMSPNILEEGVKFHAKKNSDSLSPKILNPKCL